MLCCADTIDSMGEERENTFQLRQRMYFAPKYILENKVSIKKIVTSLFIFAVFGYNSETQICLTPKQ